MKFRPYFLATASAASNPCWFQPKSVGFSGIMIAMLLTSPAVAAPGKVTAPKLMHPRAAVAKRAVSPVVRRENFRIMLSPRLLNIGATFFSVFVVQPLSAPRGPDSAVCEQSGQFHRSVLPDLFRSFFPPCSHRLRPPQPSPS